VIKPEAKNSLKSFGFLMLALSLMIFMSACKGKEKAEAPAAEKAAAQPEAINVQTLANVLGTAEAEHSGIFDLTKGDNELWIVYHFYTPEMSDIDDDIGVEMAPKIEALYKKFKDIDRTVFVVQVSHPDSPLEWKPYCSFVMTRKVVRETGWGNFLAAELFKICQDIQYKK
jgi:hypothetical protein